VKAVARTIEGMVVQNARGLAQAWKDRLQDDPTVLGALAMPPDDELLMALMIEFKDALCGCGFSNGAPAMAQEARTISGFSDPRDDAALWIQMLSGGRSVLEEFLVDVVAPGLRMSPSEREELLDELERAFHMVAHRRLQVLCDCCLTLR